jgi:hypothetical protein
MRNFFYSLVLVFIIIFGTSVTKSSFAKSDFSLVAPSYLYKIIEVQPNGETMDLSGEVSTFNSVQVIADLGLTHYSEDRVSAFPDPKLGIGSVIRLERAPVIKLRDGKKELELRSWVTIAEELLVEKGIELGVDDKTNFRPDSRIYDGIELSITRVAITTVIQGESIKYKTETKNNSQIEKGVKKVLQKGQLGEKKLYYEVRREDGIEVSRQLLKAEIVKEPVSEIIEVGTKIMVYISGEASWYNAPAMTAACRDVPMGTMARVVNTANGKSVVVKINDYIGHRGRVIDLSSDAFAQLAPLGQGVIKNVRVEKYYP